MLVCDDLQTEVWRPDFSSSGQPDPPPWTRLRFRGREISNSLEWAEWSRNPVQTILCDACGIEQCAGGGYVHVSRLIDLVLWSSVQPSESEIGRESELAVIRRFGVLAIPVAYWNELPVPRAEQLAPANHAVIRDAWILGAGRNTESECYGADTLSKEDAIALVDGAQTFLRKRADEPFEQPVIAPPPGARFEKLYFDGPAERDWTAFAFAGEDVYLVLDRDHVIRLER